MKRILAIGAVLAVSIVGFGCAGNTTNNPNGYNLQWRQLLGTWRESNIEAGDMETGCPGQLNVDGTVLDCGGSIEFKSDHTFVNKVERFGQTIIVREGTWTVARNLVSLYYGDVIPSQAERQFTVLLGEDGNSFEATESQRGETVKLLYIRQTE